MSFDLGSPVLWTMGGILGLLVVATLALWLLRLWRPGVDLEEVRLRVRSWWIMALIFLVALTLTRTVSLVFFALISFLALKEFLSLIPTRRADRSVLFWTYLAIPIQYLWIDMGWYGMFIIFIPVYMFLFLPLRMTLIGETSGFLRAAGVQHWGLMVTVFCVSHVAYLLVLGGSSDRGTTGTAHFERAVETAGTEPGPALVLFLVILTQLNDVAQFLWGKALGRHKVVPKVSPNKTLEGLLGGIVTTIGVALLLAPWLTPLDTWRAVQAGLLISLAGFIGDVVISALKRDLGIKDSGTLLPGHGGILDRIDSLTYSAPLFFHWIRYLYF